MEVQLRSVLSAEYQGTKARERFKNEHRALEGTDLDVLEVTSSTAVISIEVAVTRPSSYKCLSQRPPDAPDLLAGAAMDVQ